MLNLISIDDYDDQQSEQELICYLTPFPDLFRTNHMPAAARTTKTANNCITKLLFHLEFWMWLVDLITAGELLLMPILFWF